MIIEGPVCEASQVVGWHLNGIHKKAEALALHTSGFGFNSSILWDPERWGRLPSMEATKQVITLLSCTLLQHILSHILILTPDKFGHIRNMTHIRGELTAYKPDEVSF